MHQLNTKTPYKIFGDSIEQGALDQFEACLNMEGCTQGVLMPDSHLGYSAPIGSVLKLKDRISAQLVGYDIGCGVACLEVAVNYKDVDLEALKEHILKTIPIGFNQHQASQEHTELLTKLSSTSKVLKDAFSAKGIKQLGTLGGGNHFIEVGYLESNNNIAIVIHSGSRGFGHVVASHYMREAVSRSAESGWYTEELKCRGDFRKSNINWWVPITSVANELERVKLMSKYESAELKYIAKHKEQYMKSQDVEGLHSFSINSDVGSAYYNDMNFCLEYALMNRTMMINKIAEYVLRDIKSMLPRTKKFINRNHNHAELIDGHIIHRKGATHAEKGMYGVIPGNMRDGSFIVRGKGNPDSMSSSSHGAGRVLSRKQAIAQLSLDDFKTETAKLVTNHTEKMLDEAPQAYKNIFEVMELQSDLVEVVDRVIPLLNIKG